MGLTFDSEGRITTTYMLEKEAERAASQERLRQIDRRIYQDAVRWWVLVETVGEKKALKMIGEKS
jgi:hypothetical protein